MNKRIPVYVTALAEIERYNSFAHYSGKKEDYATHGFHSLAISSVIGHHYNQLHTDSPCDLEKIYGKLIFGSLHPKFFGDVPKSIQKQYPDLAEAFKLAKQLNGKQLVIDFSPEYREQFENYIVNTKDDSMEAEIVRQSENFSVLMKCEEELRSLNSIYYKKLKRLVRNFILNEQLVEIPEDILEAFKEDIYDDFQPQTFIDVYIDTIKSIQGSSNDSVHWYFKNVYFTSFTLIINNMKEVSRWNNVRSRADMDSQHSFLVSMWTFIFCLIERIEYKREINIARAVSKSIFHDIHESITSDILSYIKRINTEVKSLIDKMENDKNYLILHLLPEQLHEKFEDYICDPKGAEEGHIVHIADKVDAVIKSLIERNRGNNGYFQEAYDECMRAIMKEAHQYNCVKDFCTYMLHEFIMAKY